MQCVLRVGCVVLALIGAEGVARAWCDGAGVAEELVVVPAGGGVFVTHDLPPDGCRMLLVGGGRWVPLRAESGRARGVVRYTPVRELSPGVVYRLVGVDEDGERVRYGVRVVGGAAGDRMAPRWGGVPRVGTSRRSGCLLDEVVVAVGVDVEDASPVRVTIEARPLEGGGWTMFATARPEGGLARVEWPLRGEWFIREGVEYEARVCAEDAAGNRSCAPAPVRFTVPEYSAERESGVALWYARALWRAGAGSEEEEPEVVAPPPEETRAGGAAARTGGRC